MSKVIRKFFCLFGYQITIEATPMVLQKEIDRINELIRQKRFEWAQERIDDLHSIYGMEQKVLDLGRTLRFLQWKELAIKRTLDSKTP
jgi:hypothetical protein